MPTISTENYLKAIFHLQSVDGSRAKTKQIAEMLQVSLPSATNMLKNLASAGLVEHESYNGALLTEKGQQQAIQIVRKHRLIEAFLVETLGYNWDEVHVEAERLEHAVSDGLANRIDDFLKHPRFDPHGDPIPDATGKIHVRPEVSLLDLSSGDRAEIVRILDQKPDVLRYLQSKEIIPGASVYIVELMPHDGPLHLRVAARDVTISRSLARHVMSQTVSERK